MKKLLLLFLCLVYFNKGNAQVVFCPSGAEWHSLFSKQSVFLNTHNETIKYIGDSISGSDTLKILSHFWFFMTCGPIVQKTFIKQKGDTIFFYNQLTQGTWQILYNYAAQPGQTWQTTVVKTYTYTFTFTVQSVSTVTINGFNLKRLTVSSNSWAGTQITERLGSDAFLFHFSQIPPNKCEGDVFLESLCYKDNVFGTKQFGTKSCDYYTADYLGINEVKGTEIKIYPNPLNNSLTIETESGQESQMILMDISGREVKKVRLEQKDNIDVSNLTPGIYFITVSKNREVVYKSKVVKE